MAQIEKVSFGFLKRPKKTRYIVMADFGNEGLSTYQYSSLHHVKRVRSKFDVGMWRITYKSKS